MIAASLSTLLSLIGTLSFFNGISVALLVYIITYYAFKSFFITQVEKPTKIFTTGIGAYFLTWIVAWVVFYTLFIPR